LESERAKPGNAESGGHSGQRHPIREDSQGFSRRGLLAYVVKPLTPRSFEPV